MEPSAYETEIQHLHGQLSALTHLCAAIAATLSPAAAHVLLVQAERVTESANERGTTTPFSAGYLSVAQIIQAAIKTASEAEKIRGLTEGEKH